jgi:hypothetical protein
MEERVFERKPEITKASMNRWRFMKGPMVSQAVI